MASKQRIRFAFGTTATPRTAARFYAKTFPDSSVGAVHRAPGDFPSGKKGDVLTVEFTVMGIPCLGLNGGPAFKHNEAFSFQVATADQAETDRYWNAIVGNGGEESACGWCKDKWGLSWQIHADRPTKAFTDPDRAAAKRAFDAMMKMKRSTSRQSSGRTAVEMGPFGARFLRRAPHGGRREVTCRRAPSFQDGAPQSGEGVVARIGAHCHGGVALLGLQATRPWSLAPS
jgi:2-polyprenyl-6-hydroxyphenyl methylase/3-demethylubiquinone-9 3-methyltransferase